MAEPSPFFLANAAALRHAADSHPVLDLACGRGRHARACAELGLSCVAIDRDPEALRELARYARGCDPALLPLRADIECGFGIPLKAGSIAAVLVFRFLFRPLAKEIVAVLRPGGLLLYETFTDRQREFAYGPRNPAFLLSAGELPELFAGLEIVSYEEGIFGSRRPEALARLVGRKPA